MSGAIGLSIFLLALPVIIFLADVLEDYYYIDYDPDDIYISFGKHNKK